MELRKQTLKTLSRIIACQDGEQPYYFNGQDLVSLFNEVGFEEISLNQSRGDYVFERLEEMNDTKKLNKFLELFLENALVDVESDRKVEFIENINKKLNLDGYRVESNGRYNIVRIDGKNEKVENNVYFEDIQVKIINEIRKAKHTIWVVVAWFTDKKIFNELKRKAKEGVNVRVLISDDKKNDLLKFEDYFETCVCPSRGYNMMHDKFCVIDSKTVISGSYNWSKAAMHNDETIEIKKDSELAEKYLEEFKQLREKCKVYYPRNDPY